MHTSAATGHNIDINYIYYQTIMTMMTCLHTYTCVHIKNIYMYINIIDTKASV